MSEQKQQAILIRSNGEAAQLTEFEERDLLSVLSAIRTHRGSPTPVESFVLSILSAYRHFVTEGIELKGLRDWFESAIEEFDSNCEAQKDFLEVAVNQHRGLLRELLKNVDFELVPPKRQRLMREFAKPASSENSSTTKRNTAAGGVQ